MASSSSSSSSCARVHRGCQAPPLPALLPVAAPPEPQAPAAVAHPVFLEQMYLEEAELQRRDMAFFCRSLALALLIFLITATIAFVLWVIQRPNFPQVYIASALIANFTTSDTAVRADCNTTLVVTNTNRHFTAIYDHFEIYLLYPSEEVLLAEDFQPPFVQHARSQTAIESNLTFTGVYLGAEVTADMMRDMVRGVLGLRVKVYAELRYRNRKWRTHTQFMCVSCGVVFFVFDSIDGPGVPLNPPIECDVYLSSK